MNDLAFFFKSCANTTRIRAIYAGQRVCRHNRSRFTYIRYQLENFALVVLRVRQSNFRGAFYRYKIIYNDRVFAATSDKWRGTPPSSADMVMLKMLLS